MRTRGTRQAEERFKEVQSAYDLLGDPEKRKQYDTFGRARGRRGAGAGPFQNVRFEEADFDLWRPARRAGQRVRRRRAGRRARPRPERGADLESRVRLSFEDALRGVAIRVPSRSRRPVIVRRLARRAGDGAARHVPTAAARA